MQQKEQLIVLKSEFESKLIDFYNEVIDLIQHSWKTPNRHPLPYDLLVTFCLMFGCNLLNNDSRNTSRNFKLDEGYEGKQMRLIISQVREIEEKFDRFADRVKIIYFLLIMYMSYGPIASRDDFFTFYFSEETNEVHRTLLDLLNSELIDFRNNNVSSLRISLLLKLDQFVWSEVRSIKREIIVKFRLILMFSTLNSSNLIKSPFICIVREIALKKKCF